MSDQEKNFNSSPKKKELERNIYNIGFDCDLDLQRRQEVLC